MSYPKYESYKDSGVEWLGEVPAHWSVSRAKFVSTIFVPQRNKPELNDAEGIAWATMEDMKSAYIESTKYKVRMNDALKAGSKILKQGSVIASCVGNFGIASINKIDVIINQQLQAFIPTKIKPEYLRHLVLNSKYYFESIGTAATVVYVNQQGFAELPVLVPPYDEQQQLIGFLDKETAKIDALIEKQQRLIELLEEKRQAVISHAVTKGLNPDVKMKDSGVEWLGEVPAHWAVRKLKFVALALPSNIDKKSYEGESPVYLCNYTDVYYNEEITQDLSFMKATASQEQIRKFTLKSGDTIITKDSEDPNDIAIPTYVPDDMEGVVCGYHLTLLRAENGLVGVYLKRVLDSRYARSIFATRANGLTRYGLSTYAIKNFILPLPSIDEQQQIAAFLDKETTKIDTFIEKAQHAIELLQERRTALISAAVTGKIDVRMRARWAG